MSIITKNTNLELNHELRNYITIRYTFIQPNSFLNISIKTQFLNKLLSENKLVTLSKYLEKKMIKTFCLF